MKMQSINLILILTLMVFLNNHANAKIHCNPPSLILPTPLGSAHKCNMNDFSDTHLPKATISTIVNTNLFQNKKACDMSEVISGLGYSPIVTYNIRNQAIMLEDDWKKEYTKTNTNCSSGIAACTVLGYELCHGSEIPGQCSGGTCVNSGEPCTYDTNCSYKSYYCYDQTGDKNDSDINDHGFYKTGVVHQIAIPQNQLNDSLGDDQDFYILAGGELYLRALSAGSFLYKDYPLSIKMPCRGEVFFKSFSPSNINQIKDDSDYTSTSKGRSLSCPKRLDKGELVVLNNTDTLTGAIGTWPENFCGEIPSTNEINQNPSNFKSGLYSGIVFKCDLGNYNGPVGSEIKTLSDNDWIAFPEDVNYTSGPSNYTVLDNNFIRPNNTRSFLKFQSNIFTHLMGASETNNTPISGLILEQNDITTWFPEFLSGGQETNWACFLEKGCGENGCDTSFLNLITCDGGVSTTRMSLFDTLNKSDPSYVLNDTNITGNSENVSAKPTTVDQQKLFEEIPFELRNKETVDSAYTTTNNNTEAIVTYKGSTSAEINREAFINHLEIISEEFGSTYGDCGGENSGTCTKQEYQECSMGMLGGDCAPELSVESSETVGCCYNTSTNKGTCLRASQCKTSGYNMYYCPSPTIYPPTTSSPTLKCCVEPPNLEFDPPDQALNIPIEFQPIPPTQMREPTVICEDMGMPDVPNYYVYSTSEEFIGNTIQGIPNVSLHPSVYVYMIVQHQAAANAYKCDMNGPNPSLPYIVSNNALKYNKNVETSEHNYKFNSIVGNSISENVIGNKIYVSNVLNTSYYHNYSTSDINNDMFQAFCSEQIHGHCAWAAVCTTPPEQNFFATSPGVDPLQNCELFSAPTEHKYVFPEN